jgi:hypothetical protein
MEVMEKTPLSGTENVCYSVLSSGESLWCRYRHRYTPSSRKKKVGGHLLRCNAVH